MKIDGHTFSSLDNPHSARHAKSMKKKALKAKKSGKHKIGTMTSHYSGKTYKTD